jgi:6-pyruvoyl-tetrahydropterin synthase
MTKTRSPHVAFASTDSRRFGYNIIIAMYEISVQHSFTAAHALPLPDGTMEQPHSHEWRLTATFRSTRLDEKMGVVIDFVAVSDVLAEICRPLDDADLNALPDFADAPVSAEYVAKLIADRLTEALADLLGPPGGKKPWLRCVNVTEAPGCSATYYADASPP